MLERVQHKRFLCPFLEVITVLTLSEEGDSGYSKPNTVKNDSAL